MVFETCQCVLYNKIDLEKSRAECEQNGINYYRPDDKLFSVFKEIVQKNIFLWKLGLQFKDIYFLGVLQMGLLVKCPDYLTVVWTWDMLFGTGDDRMASKSFKIATSKLWMFN